MAIDAPEIDTTAQEAPAAAHESHPGPAAMAVTFLVVAGLTALANVVVLGIAQAAGAVPQVDLGSISLQVSWWLVIAATLAWLLAAVLGWGLLAHRVPALAHLWVPLHWGMALVAGAALVAVAGSVATAITLLVMNVLASAAAAHAVPRRLPR